MGTKLLQNKIYAPVFLLLAAIFMGGCSSKSGAPEPSQPTTLSIKSISPTQAKVGDLVTIKGSGFGSERSLIKVFFGYSELVRPTTFNDTMITVIVPPDATAGRIMVSILLGESVTSDQLFGLLTDGTDYANLNKIQYTGSGSLSTSRTGMAAGATGNKIIFAGGRIMDGGNLDIDIYDVTNNTWQSGRLSEPREGLSGAGAGNKILFAGGTNANGDIYFKTVDIYDITTEKWTTSQLSVARTGMAAVGAGALVYFAGGRNASGFSDVIDIYNTQTGVWTTAKLSFARADMAACASNGKIVFAGGEGVEPAGQKGRVVDICNTEGPAWNTALLSVGRKVSAGLAGAGASRKILFAGGSNALDPVVEVYDTSAGYWGTWTTMPINEEVRTGVAAAAGTKLVFSMAKSRTWTYDVYTGYGINDIYSGTATPTVATSTRNRIIFAGASNKAFDTFTVFK